MVGSLNFGGRFPTGSSLHDAKVRSFRAWCLFLMFGSALWNSVFGLVWSTY